MSLQNKIWNLPDRRTILQKFIYDKEGKLALPTQILAFRVHGPALILKTEWVMELCLLIVLSKIQFQITPENIIHQTLPTNQWIQMKNNLFVNYVMYFYVINYYILVSPCPSVHLSICGQNRVHSVSSTILVQSISYLHALSIWEGVLRVMFVSKFKKLKFWRILWICNFDFVFFWLGIQYDSIVWVIMRRPEVASERRRSICSSLFRKF